MHSLRQKVTVPESHEVTVRVPDTNVLLRLANPAAPEHSSCVAAVTRLAADGVVLAVVPQCLVEFWVVATRPVVSGGRHRSLTRRLKLSRPVNTSDFTPISGLSVRHPTAAVT